MNDIKGTESNLQTKLRLLGEVNQFLEDHPSDWTESETEQYTRLHKALMDAVNAQLDREASTSND